MDTLEFLRRVLPEEGFYCSVLVVDGKPGAEQALFDTMEELATHCLQLDGGKNHIYYATSTFNTKFTRKQTNVKLNKCLFIDIDCGPDKVGLVDKHDNPEPDKGYANQKLGLGALKKYVLATGMPKPMIVSSGRGLHIYWVLDKPLPPEEWKPLADAFKASFSAAGCIFDPAVSADSARVLRPIGTHNPRNGNVVKVLSEAPTYDKQTLQNILQPYVQSTTIAGPSIPAPGGGAVRNTGLGAALAVTSSYTPALAAGVRDKCKQIEWAVANQTNVSEPLWYNVIGVAAYCLSPEDTAKEWSKKHPAYNEIETLRKLRQWQNSTTGPTTCAKFKIDRPTGCKGCTSQGNITSPAQLGVQHATVEVAEDAPDLIAREVPVPWKFKRVELNGITTMMHTLDGTDVPACPFEIYPTGYGRDETLGYETVRYKWKRTHVGWQDLVFRQAYLNDENREFVTAIADQGIVLNGKSQVERFRLMLRAYMNELRSRRSLTNIYNTMGWKEDCTQFVIGNTVYKRSPTGEISQEDVALTKGSARAGQNMYSQAGTIEAWSKATAILETSNMPWHMFTLGQSFAAPLWALTGLKGITISLWGDSGGGKSIVQLWQQSVWGDPAKLHFPAKFTQNAMFSRLGVYGNLPMTIDEATNMEGVGDFCYQVTQGKDKARLGRNAEERMHKEWATTVTISTNLSWVAKLAATGTETDAQMARLLEVHIPIHKMFLKSSNAGRAIAEFLMKNHGLVGEAYIKALLRIGKEGLQKRIADVTRDFSSIYNFTFTGTERFWELCLILLHVGCQIATEEGLIAFDYKLGIKWALSQIANLRTAVIATRLDAFELIDEFLHEGAADIVTVMHTDGMQSSFDASRLPRTAAKARFDVYRKSVVDDFDRGTVMLILKPFKQWLASRGYEFSAVRNEVRAAGFDVTPASGRFLIGRNTSLKLGQLGVLGVNLDNDRLRGYLKDPDAPNPDAGLPSL